MPPLSLCGPELERELEKSMHLAAAGPLLSSTCRSSETDSLTTCVEPAVRKKHAACLYKQSEHMVGYKSPILCVSNRSVSARCREVVNVTSSCPYWKWCPVAFSHSP
jgi:hypothetical protein